MRTLSIFEIQLSRRINLIKNEKIYYYFLLIVMMLKKEQKIDSQ